MRFHNSARWINNAGLSARSRRVAACAAKQVKGSRGAAEAQLRSLERRFGTVVAELQVYQCPICRQWHLGRSRSGAASVASVN